MGERDLNQLPKAHLHLHFAGSMRHSTLVDLAETYGIRLPDALRTDWPPKLSAADEKGWFRFQRLYDIARSVLRTPAEVERVVLEAAEDDAAEGSRWLELQVDPSGYATVFRNTTNFTELVLAAAEKATAQTGTHVKVIIAANRTKHPFEARALARLARQYVDDGVVGFGLSNDERRGETSEFAKAFGIAERAGLTLVPHGGELCGPEVVHSCIHELHADRLGHGVRSVEDPELLDQIVQRQIGLEVCPASNVSLGIYPGFDEVPLRTLFDAGALIALGADDPLLFGSRLGAQHRYARSQGFTDSEIAELARRSILASTAPQEVRRELLGEIDGWLAS